MEGAKMKFRILFATAVMVASSGAVVTGLVGTTGIASAHPFNGWSTPYTCTGGDFQTGTFVPIPSGTYANITVTGACQPAPNAVITVLGDVNVAPGAALDAQSYPSTITVGRDVTAAPGSLLGLGCLPDPLNPVTQEPSTLGHPCTDPLTGKPSETAGNSNINVNGNIFAWGANAVLLNGITVRGSVTLIGSEGTTTATERATAIPWAIKTNTIGGNLIVSDMTPLWLGVLDNHVGGNVILFNIQITDGLPTNPPTPPADVDTTPTIFVAFNTIGQNLGCWGLGPYLFDGNPGEVNAVPHAFGQCSPQ
jgi:hypothetical protein